VRSAMERGIVLRGAVSEERWATGAMMNGETKLMARFVEDWEFEAKNDLEQDGPVGSSTGEDHSDDETLADDVEDDSEYENDYDVEDDPKWWDWWSMKKRLHYNDCAFLGSPFHTARLNSWALPLRRTQPSSPFRPVVEPLDLCPSRPPRLPPRLLPPPPPPYSHSLATSSGNGRRFDGWKTCGSL
jgi:hypothetical protein